MFAVSVASVAPLRGCGLMMVVVVVVCMGPMFSQRVRGWFHREGSTEAASGAPSDAGTDAGTAAEVAALRCEVAELCALRADAPYDGAVR